MFHIRRLWNVVVAAGLALASLGCSSEPSREPAARPNARKNVGVRTDKNASPPGTSHSGQESAVVEPKPEEPPQPATIPKVNLSDELRANCLVKVGDVLPKTDQLDINGKTQSLAGLYGKKLTVVCFWTAVDRRTAT